MFFKKSSKYFLMHTDPYYVFQVSKSRKFLEIGKDYLKFCDHLLCTRTDKSLLIRQI